MSYTAEVLTLEATSVGLTRTIHMHRFAGDEDGPTIYLQAGLHAGEVPGMVIATRLVALLKDADAKGLIRGRVTVVPAANPVGLAATVLGVHIGRAALASGQNFNRFFPDLAALAQAALTETPGTDAAANVALLREAMAKGLDALTPKTEVDDTRRQLMRLAVDADYVYDMHAEEDALFAAVLAPWTLPYKDEMLGVMRPDCAFFADYPPLFDTAMSRPWAQFQAAFPGAAIPQACKSVTLEMRGSGHVDDTQAMADAQAIFDTFAGLGAIDAAPARPESAPCDATPFEGVEFIRASHPGIVVYHRALGDAVTQGDTIAEIVRPDRAGTPEARVPVIAGQTGVFFARAHTVNVQKDEPIAKIAGATPLPDPKHY